MSADPTESGGKYVESVDVLGGTIVVTYGSAANGVIAGRTLAIQPYVMPDEPSRGAARTVPPGRRRDGRRCPEFRRCDRRRTASSAVGVPAVSRPRVS